MKTIDLDRGMKLIKAVHGCIFLMFSITNILGQGYATGLIIDSKAYNEIPRQSQYGDGGKTESKALEGIYKVDLKPYCPRPIHQGLIGSCVGWSCGYAALTLSQNLNDASFVSPNRDMINKKAKSALFIYNQIKMSDCDGGSRIEDALRLLQQKGNVYHKDYDLVIEKCDRMPSEKEIADAAHSKILDYMALFGRDDNELVKINKIKLSLVQKKPVVIAMELNENFKSLTTSDIFWFPEVGNTNPIGAHAMCVVGFDDGKEAFEVMNSWGDLWGNNGFIWIKYDDFVKYCYHAYQFSVSSGISDVSSPSDIQYTGEFAFRYPKLIYQDKIDFEYEQVSLHNGAYKLSKKDWKVGEKFQLVSTQVQAGMYLYVFSFDPDGQTHVHWPRDETFDSNFSGIKESAVITTTDVELIIPGPTRALQFDKRGQDYVIVLYSSKPIINFNDKLMKLKKDTKKGNIVRKLYKNFDNMLIPLEKISYEKNKMKCSSQSKSGFVLPIILEINVN